MWGFSAGLLQQAMQQTCPSSCCRQASGSGVFWVSGESWTAAVSHAAYLLIILLQVDILSARLAGTDAMFCLVWVQNYSGVRQLQGKVGLLL